MNMKNQTGLLIAAAIACIFSISPGAFAKTAKECTAEWRADKAGMQARGTTEKAYVEQCRAGGTSPSATAPEPKPTAAAPAPQRPAPSTTAAPAPAPAPQPPASRGSANLEA